MNFKKILCNDSVCNYARFGILFGLCFPIIAIAFDIFFVKNISLTWSNIKLTQSDRSFLRPGYRRKNRKNRIRQFDE